MTRPSSAPAIPDNDALRASAYHVTQATDVADAVARIVEGVAELLKVPAAVLVQRGTEWYVEASEPKTWPPTRGDEDVVFVPLGAADGVDRNLALAPSPGRRMDPAVLKPLGRMLGEALALVALRTAADNRRRRDRHFHRFTSKLLHATEPARLRQAIVRTMAQAVDAHTAALALYLPAERSLAVVATQGYPSAVVEHIRIRPGEGVIGSVFMSGRPLLATAAPASPDSLRHRRYRASSYMAVPLRSAKRVTGVVCVTDPASGSAFTREHLQVLRAYAAPAALALARESLRAQTADLAHLATVDALTGLFNRRYFDSRLTEEIQRDRREATGLALLMIDVDDFKALNDARGHPYGDGVLRELAEILRRSVRIFDVCARYGGEEFAILMPGASPSTALQVAERIRRHAETHFSGAGFPGPPGRPTLSIGVSSALPDMTGEGLVAAADSALIGAKAAGKNTVKMSTGSQWRGPSPPQ